MKIICVLFLAVFTFSCDKQDNINEKAKPTAEIQSPTKKPKAQIPPEDIEIKKNLKNIQIQQREINLRLERLDHKIKMKKKRKKIKVNPTCLRHICSGGKAK